MAMDRRAAAGLIIGAPAAAFAVGGDSPKQAYFAKSPISSPFGETYTNQATRLWTELGETERGIYTRIARETKTQLDNIVGYIQKNEWDRARTAMRLYTYETRKSMTVLTSASGDPVSAFSFLPLPNTSQEQNSRWARTEDATYVGASVLFWTVTI